MALERFANAPIPSSPSTAWTTLSAGIDASTTTIPVVGFAVFPSAVQFRILIDNEYLLVTAGAGTTSWTATRGIEGSTAAIHASGSSVFHVLTEAGLANHPRSMTTAGDLEYLSAAFAPTRLGIGSAGQVLTVAGELPTWATPAAGGVTSVALSVPSFLSVTGSPVTTTGTLAVSLATQNANLVFAGPTTGVAAAPTFRSLVAGDIPDLSASYLTPGSLPTSVLAFNTVGHPVDPTGVVDSTAGIQAAMDSIAATGGTVILPYGSYKVSAPLLRGNSRGFRLIGEGVAATKLIPTAALAGLSIITLTNCEMCEVSGMWILGSSGSAPSAAIQSIVDSTNTGGYTSTKMLLRDLLIGSLSAASIQYAVRWTAAATDQNNDQTTIDNVNVINFSVAAYSIEMVNSLWHTFLSGSAESGPIVWKLAGGSFASYGMRTTVTDAVMDFLSGTYQHASTINGLQVENTPILIRTAAVASPGVHMTGISFKGGGSSSVFSIDYNFTDSSFSIDGKNIGEGSGTKFRFTDPHTSVTLSNARMGVSSITYAGSLQSFGNSYTSGVPTWVPGGATVVMRTEFGNRDDNGNLLLPSFVGYAGGTGAGLTVPALTTGAITGEGGSVRITDANDQTIIVRNPASSGYTHVSIQNDSNISNRALVLGYSGSATGGAVTNGPTGEQGYAGTIGNYPFTIFTENTARMTFLGSGHVGIGVVTPTAALHLRAGTATASTSPLKFTSGPLQTTAEAGAVEFLTDAFYATITTGAARKTFAFTDSLSAYLPLAGGTLTGTLGIGASGNSGIALLVVGSFAGAGYAIDARSDAAGPIYWGGVSSYRIGELSWDSATQVSVGGIASVGLSLKSGNTSRLIISPTGTFTWSDAVDFAFNTTTGTKIGTAADQKIGHYGVTPVVQGASVADATDAASAITQLNALISRIEACGLIATV